MATQKTPSKNLHLDKDETYMMLHALELAYRSYLETEIHKHENHYVCNECGNTASSKTGITHNIWCWFRRFSYLKAKLTALSTRLATPPS